MRERGKRLQQLGGDHCFNLDASLELPCKKHSSSSSSSSYISTNTSSSYGGGICPFCLREKLAQLVCPQCGEQRLPNCSCSVFSEPKAGEPQIPLRRSNSTSVSDIDSRGGGLWGIKKLFRKKRGKGNPPIPLVSSDETWVPPRPCAIQRSTSLSSYRMPHSAARPSTVSNASAFLMESAKMSCFSESEARMSNFDYDFSCPEDPKFIDFNLHLQSEFTRDRSLNRMSSNDGDPARFSVADNESTRYRKSRKGWRWLFKPSSDMGKDKGWR